MSATAVFDGTMAETLAASSGPIPQTVDVTWLDIPGSPAKAMLLQATSKPIGRLLFIDGFTVLGASIRHAEVFAAKLADRTGCAVLVPDFSSLDQRTFEEILSCVETCADELAGLAGPVSRSLVFAGDGVGAAIAMASAQLSAEKGRNAPLHVSLISPILHPEVASAKSDVTPDWARFWSAFTPDTASRSHLLDPKHSADEAPPFRSMSVLVGEKESTVPSVRRLVKSLREAGVNVNDREYVDAEFGFMRRLSERTSEAAFQHFLRDVRKAVFADVHRSTSDEVVTR